jgi:hypothetical protein
LADYHLQRRAKEDGDPVALAEPMKQCEAALEQVEQLQLRARDAQS